MTSTKKEKKVYDKKICDAVITPDNIEEITAKDAVNGNGGEPFDDDPLSEVIVCSTNKCIDRWSKSIERIKQPLLSLIKAIARYSAKNPGIIISSTVTFSILFLAIGYFTGFRIVTSNVESFTPYGTESAQRQDWLENESGFPQVDTVLRFNVHSDGKNVLGVNGVSHVFQVLDAIISLPEYAEVCESEGGNHCRVISVTGFWSDNYSTFLSEVSTDEEAIRAMRSLEYPNGTPVERIAIFGNLKMSLLEEGKLEAAQAYSTILLYPNENKAEFEKKAMDILLNFRQKWKNNDENPWRLENYAVGTSLEKEMNRAIQGDIMLISFAYVMMFVLACLYFARWHRVQSQSIIGIGAVLSVALSLFFTFGIFFCMGLPFTSMTQMLPFVLAGIGLDDAFIITGAFSRTDPNMDILDRVDKTMDEIGMSIFISTVTTCITFILSTISTIPIVRWFCYYAATSIMVDFLFQITFFVAFLVYNERRKKANRYDILCCFKDRLSSISSEPIELSEEKASVKERLMAFYVDILLRPVTMVLVLLIFATIFTFGLLSAMKMKLYWDFTMLVPKDSYVRDYFSIQDVYFKENDNIFFGTNVYFRNIDVSSKTNRDNMSLHIKTIVDESKYVTRYPSFFWLDDFENFIASNQSHPRINDLDFNDQLTVFLNKEPFNSLYSNTIVRNETGAVTTSNVWILFSNVSRLDVSRQLNILSEQRRLSRESPLNIGRDSDEYVTFTHADYYYGWEFSGRAIRELIQTSIFALASVFVIALIFIPHPSGCVFVTVTVAMMFVEIIGLFQAAGIYINSLTTLTLVMAIGLSVDFIMHIVYSYFETNEESRKGKVYVAMMTMGSSLLMAGCSTLCGTFLMAFGQSEISWIFFMTFVGIVVLGVTHSLILLPVILSLVGPLFNPEKPNFRATPSIKGLAEKFIFNQ